MSEKIYDIVVFGATGFTGGFIANYLAERKQPEPFKFAIVGRSADKLSSLKKELETTAKSKGNIITVDCLIVDASNQESVDNAVRKTHVVISAMGPFQLYGTPVVDACVRLNAHYCDITGETPWVKSIIEKYDAEADKNGVLIVPMCGFESIPSDMAAFALADHFRQTHALKTSKVSVLFTELKAQPSGGTLASACELLDQPRSVLQSVEDPYCFNPANGDYVRHEVPKPFGWIPELGLYKSPSLTEGANSRVVRRSVFLTKAFGDFLYEESEGHTGIFGVVKSTLGLITIGALLGTRFIRNLLRKYVFYGSGQGPSAEDRAKFRFHLTGLGLSEPGKDGTIKKAKVEWDGPSDPFYSGETCKYAAEAGLSLALKERRAKLPLFAESADFGGRKGGVITPSTAFGNVMLEALRKEGTVIDVTDI